MSQPNQPTSPSSTTKPMDSIMALCKRRGFIYQASEIYGGINGFWDYGPLGSLLKRNLREAWFQDCVLNPCGGRAGPSGEAVSMVPLDTCIIQHPKVWEASGHIAGFNDPMVDDKETKQRFRADHLIGLYAEEEGFEPSRAMKEAVAGGRISVTMIPRMTIVANGAAEAVGMINATPKMIKPFKIVEMVSSVQTKLGLMVEMKLEGIGGKRFDGVLMPVGQDDLKEHHEKIPSPFTGKAGQLTPPRAFNLMFKTFIGATASEDDVAYLRPETAQGIFVNFKNVVDTCRVRVPFGIAQTGKAFRNEVTPRNFTFRSREFEQMEIEFFCHPGAALDWYGFWRAERLAWWKNIGLAGDNLRLREHETDELAHYSKGTCDIEYRFPFTAPDFGELEGVAYRGDFDLTQHTKHSGIKLDYFDTDRGELLPNGGKKGERYMPHVIEPSAGLDRGVLALLCEAYTRDESRPSPEFMKLHPRVAPIKAAVFPLVNKDGMPEVADKLHAELHKRFGRAGFIETDAKQSIGKRYARMDEAGCPFCFTIDGDTLKDQTVTMRDRDSGQQQRVSLDKAADLLGEKLGV